MRGLCGDVQKLDHVLNDGNTSRQVDVWCKVTLHKSIRDCGLDVSGALLFVALFNKLVHILNTFELRPLWIVSRSTSTGALAR